MSRLLKPALACLLVLSAALIALTACQPAPSPTTELPTPLPAATATPQRPSSMTVTATGGDLEVRDTQVALLSAINWKSLSAEVLTPGTELIVLVEGEAVAELNELASDPETLKEVLVDSTTGAAMTVTLLYPEGDDELLQAAVSIARNLKGFGVRSSLSPVEAGRLQASIDTHTAAGEEVLAVSR